MTRMSVKQGKVRSPTAEEAKVIAGKPMRWAIRNLSGQAVSICDLRRDETGLACKCTCPACGSALQAVNAGVGREHFLRANTLGQFFRHETGQQRDNCLVVIARLAALQLLVEQREIDLPPPTHRALVPGISGHLYQGEATATRRRMYVREHTWIDSQLASITLDDGHTVLLRLDTQRTVRNEGDYDAIITITVDNPDVASWDMAEILAKMKIGDEVESCWDKHWEDEELQSMATQDAEQQATKYLDLLPSVLGDLEGLTLAQKSESLLHHVIKSILLQAHSIVSPVYSEPLHRYMADGETISREVMLALGDLGLSGAVSEWPIAGIVADVFCSVRPTRGEPFDLIIEVAVTHRVDEVKLKKIEAMGVACLEIDVRGFRQKGRVTVDELTAEVLRNPGNKRWVYHPLVAARRAEVHQALDEVDKSRKEALAREHRTRRWLDSLTQAELLKVYRQALVQHWQWGRAGVVSGHFIELHDLHQRLVDIGFPDADESALVERTGVLHFLHLARSHSHAPMPANILLTDMCSALAHSREFRSLITYCLIGLKVYKPVIRGAQGAEMESIRLHVANSLQAGEIQFARSRKFDALIAALFPELASSLEAEFGTHEHARGLQKAKRERESARIEQARVSRVALEAAMKREENRRAVNQAIFNVSRQGWQAKLGLASDVDQILAHNDMKIAAKRFNAYGVDVREVLTSAWNAREMGTTLLDWFQGQNFDHPDQVHALKSLLKLGWLA